MATEVNVAKDKGEKMDNTIYARIDGEGDDALLIAYDNEGDVVDDANIKMGQVVEVGVYKLERIKKVRKVLEEV